MNKFRVRLITLAAIFLVGTLAFLSATPPASAQTASSTPTGPVIDPAISVLQSVVATQQIQINDLQRNQEYETREREYKIRDLQWKWGIAGVVGAVAILIASWFGINGLNDLRGKINEAKNNWKNHVDNLEKEWEIRSQLLLDKAIYKFDPSNLPIKLPSGATKIHQLLTRRKLGKIELYENLEDLKHEDLAGVIVVSMLDREKFASKEEEFKQFVRNRKLDTALTGIILYTGSNRASDETTTIFDNLVTANYPATVVSNIFVVGRGLKNKEE